MHRYIRALGNGKYRIYECRPLPAGHWLADIASGPTVKEYDTDGRDIAPETLALAEDRRGQAYSAVRY